MYKKEYIHAINFIISLYFLSLHSIKKINISMSKGEISRQKILIEAFRLFATMPYDRVSFSVLEKKIGISRGSMIYYFKNKEGLREVVHTYVYGTSSIKAVPDAYRLSLCSFYNYFIEILKREKEQMLDTGIMNMNEALMRIENSALSYIPDFKEQCTRWYEEDLQIWKSVIENAISTGEIRSQLDSDSISYLYGDCYLGRAFDGVFTERGYDIDRLKQTYDYIYALLK